MSDFVEKVSSKNVLYTNMPLDLEIQEKGIQGIYKSILYEYDFNSNLAKIGMPIFKGAYLKIFRGTNLKVRAYSSRAVYLFKSKVYSSGKEGNIRYLLINIPETIVRVQRRQHARIPVSEEGTFYLKEEQESSKNQENVQPTKYRFITKDFSAGGLAIVTSKRLDIGQKVIIDLALKNEIRLEDMESEVVRFIGKTTSGEYIYGIKFLNLTREKEEELVRFVFKLERETSKKI
ncbi:flagellar brake protein [Petrotoga halophila]|uniref:flagellar brake protein n=1 Tax=Petrotoga halophila TaxID=301141 RepID=UPI000CDE8DAA|nr:PilZ domain-containing protein [Petrotoga halophila]